MTIAELTRAIESKKRVQKQEEQANASYDYILADLIGRSIARIYNSSAQMPELAAVYPSLFNSAEIEEQKAAKQAELSVARFKQFANFYNKRFKGGAKVE